LLDVGLKNGWRLLSRVCVREQGWGDLRGRGIRCGEVHVVATSSPDVKIWFSGLRSGSKVGLGEAEGVSKLLPSPFGRNVRPRSTMGAWGAASGGQKPSRRGLPLPPAIYSVA
jgi:hypothetical protein